LRCLALPEPAWNCPDWPNQWGGEVEFCILDDIIDKDVFQTHLEDAGQFIGIGRFRPRNNGFYGRFAVEGIKWK